MKPLMGILNEIVGLFVDDQGLALSIVGVVIVGFVLAFALHAPSVVTGAALVLGCVGALVVSVNRGRGR
jgi:hypothetical protein